MYVTLACAGPLGADVKYSEEFLERRALIMSKKFLKNKKKLTMTEKIGAIRSYPLLWRTGYP